MRVDNGKPWGSWSGPAPAAGVVADRPGGRRDLERPATAATERRGGAVAGTAKRWAEPHACGNPAELQARLDADDRAAAGAVSRRRGTQPLGAVPGSGAQRPRLPRGGRGRRRGAWGGCATTWRSGPCQRRVDSQGKVSIYNRNIYVGVLYAGRDVWVQFDPGHGEWLINDGGGQQPAGPAGPRDRRGVDPRVAIVGTEVGTAGCPCGKTFMSGFRGKTYCRVTAPRSPGPAPSGTDSQ